MKARSILLLVLAAVLPGCGTFDKIEQRTTQGPTAEQLWTLKTMMQSGREPNFDEHRYWRDQLDFQITQYLNAHPEAANSLDVLTFRLMKQVSVGMTKEQVFILAGAPVAVTTDQGEMEKLARRYWPEIKGNATEVWIYPLGWNFYFAGPRLVDITQYLPG